MIRRPPRAKRTDTRCPYTTPFRAIRVWNDDKIAAKSGFPPHPHRDMEIVTYVRTGAITHQDSLGNKGRTGAGDVQVMSAGTRSEEHTSELQSLMRTSYAVLCLKKKRYK